MRRTRSRTWLLGFSALAGTMALSAPVHAADAAAEVAAAPAPAEAPASNKVDEVIVTGALRTQRLQEAPVSVTAVPAQEFQTAGYQKPGDIQFLSASVQVAIQGANALFIRGSGTNSANGSTEQSVGMVIDGVLQGFVDDIGGDTSDLDHVEVYRGPQGTQFGMNASAGTVVFQTKNPQIGSNATTINLSDGSHNDMTDSVTQNIALTDTLAARFTAAWQNADGVFENESLGMKEGGRWMKAVRGKLLWQPTSNLSVLVESDIRDVYEYPNFPQAWGMCGPGITEPYKTIFGGVLYTGTYEGVQYNNQPLPANALPGCNGATLGQISGTTGEPAVGQPAGTTFLGEKGLVVQPLNYNSAEDQPAHRNTDAGGFQTKVDYAFDGFTLTSISAYRQMNRFFHGPLGNGYYTSGYLNNWYAAGQGSEEIRLASPTSDKLNYVLGAIAYDRDTRMKSLSPSFGYGQSYDEYPNTPYGAGVMISSAGGLQRITDINKSYGLFGDGSYHFTSKLALVGGIRMTYDDVYAGINVIPTNGAGGIYDGTIGSAPYNGHNALAILPPRSLDVQKTGYTWRIGPQYFITPDIMVYGTWAHGYKGPVVDTSVGTLDAVKPEQSQLLEAGIKSSWLDHRLTVNLTLFRQQYTDYQVTVLNQSVLPNVFQLGNAGGMLAQGGELEMTFRPTDDWRIQASLTVDDNYFTNFITSCWNAFEPIKQVTVTNAGGANAPGLRGDCVVSNGASAVQAAGTPLIDSSRYTYRVGPTYTHAFEKFKVDLSAAWFWRSSWLSAPMDPNLVDPGYGQLNLDGGVSSLDGRYRIGVFARNATDTVFVGGRQASNGGYTNVLNAETIPTVGVNLTAHFN